MTLNPKFRNNLEMASLISGVISLVISYPLKSGELMMMGFTLLIVSFFIKEQ